MHYNTHNTLGLKHDINTEYRHETKRSSASVKNTLTERVITEINLHITIVSTGSTKTVNVTEKSVTLTVVAQIDHDKTVTKNRYVLMLT